MKVTGFNLNEQNKLEQFNALPYQLYPDNPSYVRQINFIEKNSFETGFLLTDTDTVLARAVVYRSSLRLDNKRVLFIGNFEALSEVHGIFLLKELKAVVGKFISGMYLVGPVNGSTWNNYRLSTSENNYLFPNDICNASFYPTIFEHSGFSIYEKYYTQVQTVFETDLKVPQGYFIGYFNKEEWGLALQIIYDITMEAFAGAPLFTAIPFGDFEGKYLSLLDTLDTRLMPMVLDNNNEIVGYAVAYLSPFDKSMTAKTIARKTGMRYAGVGRLLSEEIMTLAKKHQVEKLYHAFMHEDNHSKALSSKYGAVPIKYYRLYKFLLP